MRRAAVQKCVSFRHRRCVPWARPQFHGEAMKSLGIILAFSILLPGQSFARDAAKPELPRTEWHWVDTFTTYDPSGKDPTIRSWYSMQGVVNFAIHKGEFKIMIGEPKDGLDTLVKGRIHGHHVNATAVPNQTDEIPQRYSGTFDEDDGAKRITLISPDGKFIGFITQAPSRSKPHD